LLRENDKGKNFFTRTPGFYLAFEKMVVLFIEKQIKRKNVGYRRGEREKSATVNTSTCQAKKYHIHPVHLIFTEICKVDIIIPI